MGLALSLRNAFGGTPGLRRELTLLVAALVVGLVLVPLASFLVGGRTLGPYAAGTLGAFFVRFYQGLGSLSPGFWMVALGPYVILLLARALLALLRG